MESMTGFGSAKAILNGFTVTASARSVNHRGLNIVLRFPREAAMLEQGAHELAREMFHRGRIDIAVAIDAESGPGSPAEVDIERAGALVRALGELSGMFNLEPGTTAFGLLTAPGVLRLPDPCRSGEFQGVVRDVVRRALTDLRDSRAREGQSLILVFRRALSSIQDRVAPISDGQGERVQAAFGKARRRVAELLADTGVDETRLAQEIAIMADRLDVSEECARLSHHAREAMDILGEPVCGMKLGFLIQEMHRELNTMGSKVTDSETVHAVIAMKELVGNMKEQAANVQ